MLVAVGRDLTSIIAYSVDGGLNWNTASATPRQRTCVAFGNGVFAAMSPSRSVEPVSVSTDGVNWVDIDPPAARSVAWADLTFDNGVFVAVGTGGQIVTSPDGFNWTQRKSSGGPLSCVGFGAGKWVALGDTTWWSSSDGAMTWTYGGLLASQARTSVAYGPGGWRAVGGNWITSGNAAGTVWSGGTAAHLGSWRSIVYAEGLFVTVANGALGSNLIMTSPTGFTPWTLRTPTSSYQWTGLVWDAEFGRFVAVSSLRDVMWSDDAITWTDSPGLTGSNAAAIAFGDVPPPLLGSHRMVMTASMALR